jgi:outer membrane protein OmpA-like peptidoglycan-associated protein
MKRLLLINLLIAFYALSVNAQKAIDISEYNSCETPYAVSTVDVTGPLGKPAATSLTIFGRKEYAVWFKFLVTQNGKLIFDIVPGDSISNYDFELYKSDGSADFCQKLKANQVEAVRSNFFGIDVTIKSRTGLSVLGNDKTYSPAVEVKNGDIYYLKVSSLLEERSGNLFLIFNYLKTSTIKGIVTSNEGNEMKDVEIYCINTRNNEKIGETLSDKQGNYSLDLGVRDKAHEFPVYDITFFHPKYMIYDTLVASSGLANFVANPFNVQMEKLKKDFQYPQNVYFTPNSPNSIVEPESYNILRKIYKLMMLNNTVTIRLEGHSNGFYPSTEIDQQLSEDRANAVKEYLTKLGIDPTRILVHGCGCQNMLFPFPTSEKEEGYNRRVEIFINKK